MGILSNLYLLMLFVRLHCHLRKKPALIVKVPILRCGLEVSICSGGRSGCLGFRVQGLGPWFWGLWVKV